MKLDKQNETAESVWYSFRVSTAGEAYLNDEGKKRMRLIEKKGICVFNKSTAILSIDWAHTDDYFKDRTLEQAMMQYKLSTYNQSKNFPEMIDIATG